MTAGYSGLCFMRNGLMTGILLIANSRHYGKYYKNYDETLLKEYLKRFRFYGKKKYKKLSKGKS